jgi:hypothetical protein
MSVAGVPIGTRASAAEQRLRRVLGVPQSRSLPGCNGETGKQLMWDTLTVFLSDSRGGPVVLSGWQVMAGTSRFAYRLPYDIQPRAAIRDVLREVPGAAGVSGEGDTGGMYVVHTDRTPDLLWLSRAPDASGSVDVIFFHGESCD